MAFALHRAVTARAAAGGFALLLILFEDKNDSDDNCCKNKTNDYAADIGRNPT